MFYATEMPYTQGVAISVLLRGTERKESYADVGFKCDAGGKSRSCVGNSAGDSESLSQCNRSQSPLISRAKPQACLLTRAATEILQVRLALFAFFALGLADDERAAADILGFIKFLVSFCQCISPSRGKLK
jgi:hypothetical protein